jgi:hypothetical protein
MALNSSTSVTSRPGVTPPRPSLKRPLPGQNVSSSRFKRIWDRTKLPLAALLVLLLLGGLAYAIFQPDPVEEVKEKFAELREKGKEMSKEERKEKFQQIRTAMNNLTDKQRFELGKDRQDKMREKLNNFFKLSKEEQLAQMKKDILEQEKRRKEWQARMAANGGGNGRGGAGAGGAGANGGRGAGGAGPNAGRGPGGGGPGGGGPGGGGPGGGGRGGWGNADARNQRQKSWLDGMSPEDRAQFSLYRGMMNQMRGQMGFGNGRGGFGGFGGFGGGPPRR